MSEDLLHELIAAVRALPAEIAAALQRVGDVPMLRDDEIDTLAAFVSAIAAAVGDRLFSVRELVAHAKIDHRLQAALQQAGCGDDSRKIGKRLQRSAGRSLKGYRCERIKDERGSAIWRISTIPRVSLPSVSR